MISSAVDYRTMSRFDEMMATKVVSSEDAVFEETDYIHTLRTINHLLEEQKAEVACFLDSSETKYTFVSPPYADVQRALLHQRIAISLLATDHPIRTRYITHSYYVYTLERILI